MVCRLRLLGLVLAAGICLLASSTVECHGHIAVRMNETECKVLVTWLASATVPATNMWWSRDNACSPPPVCAHLDSTVTCNDAGHVISVYLGGFWGSFGFSNTPPAEWWKLTYLQSLTLQMIGLDGTIPEEWGKLQHLTSLDISGNINMHGCLPASWGRSMQQLEQLNLNNNGFCGQLPPEWGQMTNLWELDLSATNVTITKEYWKVVCPENRRMRVFERGNVNHYDIKDVCQKTYKSRLLVLLGLSIGFAVLMATCIAWRLCRTSPACATFFQRPHIQNMQRMLSVLFLVLILADIASHIWVLKQVVPSDWSKDVRWPFISLLVGLFIPNIVAALAAWRKWSVMRPGQGTDNDVVWLLVSFIPFVLSLHFGFIYHALCRVAGLRNGAFTQREPSDSRAGLIDTEARLGQDSEFGLEDSEPMLTTHSDTVRKELDTSLAGCSTQPDSQVCPTSRWHLTPWAIVSCVDPSAYKELLDFLMAITGDPISMGVTTVYFLVYKHQFGSQVLRTWTYVLSMSLSMTHMLLVVSVWGPKLKADGLQGIAKLIAFESSQPASDLPRKSQPASYLPLSIDELLEDDSSDFVVSSE